MSPLQANDLVSSGPENETDILNLAAQLQNLTSTSHYNNPVDIDTIVDTLDMLVTAQVDIDTMVNIPWICWSLLR